MLNVVRNRALCDRLRNLPAGTPFSLLSYDTCTLGHAWRDPALLAMGLPRRVLSTPGINAAQDWFGWPPRPLRLDVGAATMEELHATSTFHDAVCLGGDQTAGGVIAHLEALMLEEALEIAWREDHEWETDRFCERMDEVDGSEAWQLMARLGQ